MNKKIEVYKECTITQEDFAPCMKDMRLTAINVTSTHIEDEYGFLNFMLAINNNSRCCERWGTNLVWIKDKKDTYYIDHIIVDENINFDLFDEDECLLSEDDYIVCTVYGEDEELICYAYVYNIHNGYYAHSVYINENLNTTIKYL